MYDVLQYLCISRDAREEINASGRESVILSDCWDNIHQTPESMVIHAVLKTSLNTKETNRQGGRGGTFNLLHGIYFANRTVFNVKRLHRNCSLQKGGIIQRKRIPLRKGYSSNHLV
jgi:hypothetical protein